MRGTRIMPEAIVGSYDLGETIEELRQGFPTLWLAQIKRLIEFARAPREHQRRPPPPRRSARTMDLQGSTHVAWTLRGYNKTMALSPQEESLISVVRALPPDEAGKVLDWARQLADLAGGRTVEWSDSWTDEDLTEATAAAVRRFEEQEREDR